MSQEIDHSSYTRESALHLYQEYLTENGGDDHPVSKEVEEVNDAIDFLLNWLSFIKDQSYLPNLTDNAIECLSTYINKNPISVWDWDGDFIINFSWNSWQVTSLHWNIESFDIMERIWSFIHAIESILRGDQYWGTTLTEDATSPLSYTDWISPKPITSKLENSKASELTQEKDNEPISTPKIHIIHGNTKELSIMSQELYLLEPQQSHKRKQNCKARDLLIWLTECIHKNGTDFWVDFSKSHPNIGFLWILKKFINTHFKLEQQEALKLEKNLQNYYSTKGPIKSLLENSRFLNILLSHAETKSFLMDRLCPEDEWSTKVVEPNNIIQAADVLCIQDESLVEKKLLVNELSKLRNEQLRIFFSKLQKYLVKNYHTFEINVHKNAGFRQIIFMLLKLENDVEKHAFSNALQAINKWKNSRFLQKHRWFTNKLIESSPKVHKLLSEFILEINPDLLEKTGIQQENPSSSDKKPYKDTIWENDNIDDLILKYKKALLILEPKNSEKLTTMVAGRAYVNPDLAINKTTSDRQFFIDLANHIEFHSSEYSIPDTHEVKWTKVISYIYAFIINNSSRKEINANSIYSALVQYYNEAGPLKNLLEKTPILKLLLSHPKTKKFVESYHFQKKDRKKFSTIQPAEPKKDSIDLVHKSITEADITHLISKIQSLFSNRNTFKDVIFFNALEAYLKNHSDIKSSNTTIVWHLTHLFSLSKKENKDFGNYVRRRWIAYAKWKSKNDSRKNFIEKSPEFIRMLIEHPVTWSFIERYDFTEEKTTLIANSTQQLESPIILHKNNPQEGTRLDFIDEVWFDLMDDKVNRFFVCYLNNKLNLDPSIKPGIFYKTITLENSLIVQNFFDEYLDNNTKAILEDRNINNDTFNEILIEFSAWLNKTEEYVSGHVHQKYTKRAREWSLKLMSEKKTPSPQKTDESVTISDNIVKEPTWISTKSLTTPHSNYLNRLFQKQSQLTKNSLPISVEALSNYLTVFSNKNPDYNINMIAGYINSNRNPFKHTFAYFFSALQQWYTKEADYFLEWLMIMIQAEQSNSPISIPQTEYYFNIGTFRHCFLDIRQDDLYEIRSKMLWVDTFNLVQLSWLLNKSFILKNPEQKDLHNHNDKIAKYYDESTWKNYKIVLTGKDHKLIRTIILENTQIEAVSTDSPNQDIHNKTLIDDWNRSKSHDLPHLSAKKKKKKHITSTKIPEQILTLQPTSETDTIIQSLQAIDVFSSAWVEEEIDNICEYWESLLNENEKRYIHQSLSINFHKEADTKKDIVSYLLQYKYEQYLDLTDENQLNSCLQAIIRIIERFSSQIPKAISNFLEFLWSESDLDTIDREHLQRLLGEQRTKFLQEKQKEVLNINDITTAHDLYGFLQWLDHNNPKDLKKVQSAYTWWLSSAEKKIFLSLFLSSDYYISTKLNFTDISKKIWAHLNFNIGDIKAAWINLNLFFEGGARVFTVKKEILTVLFKLAIVTSKESKNSV